MLTPILCTKFIILKRISGKNFKFSSFSKEIKDLKKLIKKNKIKLNVKTIRVQFYKKLFQNS